MFDSKKRKQEKDYQYLANFFKKSNIDTSEKIEEYRKKILPKAFYTSIIILITGGVLYFLFRKYYPIWGIFTLLCSAWVWASALSAKKIMDRYEKEELEKS